MVDKKAEASLAIAMQIATLVADRPPDEILTAVMGLLVGVMTDNGTSTDIVEIRRMTEGLCGMLNDMVGKTLLNALEKEKIKKPRQKRTPT